MENKFTILSLAPALAQSTGKSKKTCEDFLREFFKLVQEVLTSGESIRIKGFGTFKITEVESRMSVNINTGNKEELAPYKKVIFTPAKELASSINNPFEDFESVELDDDIVPEKVFYEAQEEQKISDENTVSVERLEEGSDEEGSDDDITYEAYTEIEKEQQPIEEEKIDLKEPEPTEKETNLPLLPVYYEEEEPKSRFGIGFLVGALSMFAVCAVIFMLGCFFDWWPINFGNAKDAVPVTVTEVPAEEPKVEEIVEQEPVYDTVSTTRYLTTIAREHYGNFNFWPYIYLENQNILGHPDRITPGTKVIVPELSKYGVDPSNKEDVEKAKQKALEIYSKYK